MKLESFKDVLDLKQDRENLLAIINATENAKNFSIPVYYNAQQYKVIVAEYDPPSQIGEAFNKIKPILLGLLNSQLEDNTKSLAALGVEVS